MWLTVPSYSQAVGSLQWGVRKQTPLKLSLQPRNSAPVSRFVLDSQVLGRLGSRKLTYLIPTQTKLLPTDCFLGEIRA